MSVSTKALRKVIGILFKFDRRNIYWLALATEWKNLVIHYQKSFIVLSPRWHHSPDFCLVQNEQMCLR